MNLKLRKEKKNVNALNVDVTRAQRNVNVANKMVKEEIINGKKYSQCEECKFYYKDKKWAEKCQAWCKEKHSCNVEITKNAVDPKKDKEKKGGCSCC